MIRQHTQWNYPDLKEVFNTLEKENNGRNDFRCVKYLNYVFVTITSSLPIQNLMQIVKEKIKTIPYIDIIDEKTLFLYYRSWYKTGELKNYEITFGIDSPSEYIKVLVDIDSYTQVEAIQRLIKHLINKSVKVKSISYRLKR